MKLSLAAFLVLLAVGGCDSATSPSSFTNTVLTLESASLPPEAGITELTPSTITFRPDGTLDVASCNSCGGRYDWDGNLLRVTELGCTEIACGSNLDLGEWLWGERVVVSDESDREDGEVTLVVERNGLLATFVFTFRDLD
jgi:heat shock protein HslJ